MISGQNGRQCSLQTN
jgi:hypothetical protein